MKADWVHMRVGLIFTLSLIPATAQVPSIRLLNLSHPSASEFQIGDRFEVQIKGAAGQPISVRTIRQGRTDWGPIVAYTDNAGRWSAVGRFEKSDFGGWNEIWTVGGKLGSPAISFNVAAPCLPGGHVMAFQSGPNVRLTCDTAVEGRQTFITPSLSDSFRTTGGTLVAGQPLEQTPEQNNMKILDYWIATGHVGALAGPSGMLGDETAELIGKLIGANALSEKETENVLAVTRAAFEKPESIAPDARVPSRTLALLGHLLEQTAQGRLSQEIAKTMAYFQAR